MRSGAISCPTAPRKPNRLHIRGPSFYNLQSMDAMVPGGMFADAVAIVSSIDPIMGEVDR